VRDSPALVLPLVARTTEIREPTWAKPSTPWPASHPMYNLAYPMRSLYVNMTYIP